MKKLAFLSFLGDIPEDNSVYDQETVEFINTLQQAREEWLAAQNFFNSVNDPDLVDYAIYGVEAARRKYMYLIKQAKVLGIKINADSLEG
jgi:hypothetical protein